MNFFRYLRSSFSAGLSLWVTGFVTAIFVVALTLLFRFSLSAVKDEALEQNMEVLEHAALQADRMLHQVEVTAKTVGWMWATVGHQCAVSGDDTGQSLDRQLLCDPCRTTLGGGSPMAVAAAGCGHRHRRPEADGAGLPFPGD